MIELIEVTKVYPPNIKALDRVSFKVEAGDFVSLVGISGAGKTTLVKILIAAEYVSSGRVILGGWDITRISRSEIPYLRRQVGVVFQDFKLLEKKTVAENIAFALEVCGAPPRRIRKLVDEVLEIVNLSGKRNRYPHQLSGGEKQRVAIARSLVHGPKILIADEPTGNLDMINAQEILDIFVNINKIGITVVLVTHNKDLVDSLNKRVIVLEEGRVVLDKMKGKYTL